MAAVIPADTHIVGDPAHTSDHNNVADVLSLFAQALAQSEGVSTSVNATAISAIQALVSNQGLYKPYQFPVARYGALGNGQVVYDGSITSGQSTLTTPGLSAPAAPTVTPGASGGTMAAGVYQVKVTLVNEFGETLASSATSATTTTGVSTLTINGPSCFPGAIGWYAYVTQVGGSSFTRQQTPGWPSTPLALNGLTQLVLTAPPTNTGVAPPVSNTTPSNPFAVGDIGKTVMVTGAGAAGVSTQVGTITGFTSSGQVTVSFTASTTTGPNSVFWATDDTAAFQAAINAAVAYAQAYAGYAEVIIPPPVNGQYYGIAGPLVTGSPTFGNAQLTLPVILPGPNKVTLALKSYANGSNGEHWEQTRVQLSGATVICMAQPFATSGAQGTSVNNNGNPAMIGGPAQPAGYGAAAVNNSTLYSNMYVILDGLRLLTPYSSNALQYCCFDFSGVAQAKVCDVGLGVTTTTENTWQTTGQGGLATGVSVGGLMPANANNDQCYMTNVSVNGGYRRGLLLTEHTDAFGLRVLYCYTAVAISGSYFGSPGASHAFNIGRMSIESCVNLLEILGSAQSGIGPIVGIGQLDTESASPTFIDDGSSGIANCQGIIGLTGLFTVTGITIGPTQLQIINWQQKPGFVTAPTVPATATPIKNTFWRWATVTLNGGAAITAVSLGATMGGTVHPTMNAVFTQSSAALASVTVRVPPGGWISWTGTSTAPTWFWMLD